MIDQSSPHLKLANKKSESESQTTCSQDDFNKTEKRNESAAVFETGKKSFIRFFILGLFIIITTIVGVLVVCLTSPKSEIKCNIDFKRTMKSSLVSSSEPQSVTVGDLNNDTYLDIIVANTGTNNIGIFLSQAGDTFSDQQTYSTGLNSLPISVAVADFNGDHNLDIVVANYGTNSIGIYYGNQYETMTDFYILSLGASRPVFITTGDFNNDNLMDIIFVSNSTNIVGIILGNGDGTFQNLTSFSTGYDSFPSALALGDFDNDHILDIVVTNYGTNNIGIFRGFGNGTFTNQEIYTTTQNSKPSSVAIGDINNDNYLDILVTNPGINNIGIFLGHGKGTFAKQVTFSINAQSYPNYITVGNFDGDRYTDVVVLDKEYDQVHILLKYTNGTFGAKTTYDGVLESLPFCAVVADFDKDNQQDIAIVNHGTNRILILSNYSIKPAARQQNYLIGHGSLPVSIIAYDFNNDSRLDLVTNSFTVNGVVLLFGDDSGSYSQTKTYSTGPTSAPKRLCIGDINNDNRMDIISANMGSDSIGVLLALDNGTFDNVIIYALATDSKPWPIAVGDFNQDNLLDIVVGKFGTGGLEILLGYGNGSFTKGIAYVETLLHQPTSISVVDIDKDKKLDLISTDCSGNSIIVLLGYVNGNFSLITTYYVGSGTCPTSSMVLDINDDDHLDLIFTTLTGGFIAVSFGYGNGTFQNMITYSTGSGSSFYSITAFDLNNDNHLDYILADIGNEAVIIFNGYNNGTLQLVKKYPTAVGSNPYGITTIKDKNSNQSHIVVTLWGTGNIAILTEYYAADFKKQIRYSTGSAPQPYSLTVGDFNGDTFMDIAVANSGTDNVNVLINSGNGTYERTKKYFLGTNYYPTYVITGNVNKDSYLDIVTANSKSQSISIMMGQGDGNFTTPIMYSLKQDSFPSAIAIDDMNNDNITDLIVSDTGTNTIGILIGYNYATFQNYTTFLNNNIKGAQNVVSRDFNNDQYFDLAITFSQMDNLGILLGYGNGSFANMTMYSTGTKSKPKELTIYDFNADRQLDIAVLNADAEDILIFLGLGNGSFLNTTRFSTGNGSNPSAIVSNDINKDGQIDLIVANFDTNCIGIFIGRGNLTFDSIVTYSTGVDSGPSSIAVGDFDHDGRIDIAASNYITNTVIIFLNYINGQFASQTTYSAGTQTRPYWLILGDFNRDNYIDIATSNYNANNVGILLGYGNGSFSDVKTYSTGDGSSPRYINIGDFNNDTIPDIAVANFGSSNFVVLFGYGDGTFLIGKQYSTGTGSSPYGLAVADLNNDNRLDVAIVSYALNTMNIFLGYGTNMYAGTISYSTGPSSGPRSIAIGDINHDGKSDIVVANNGADNVGILLGHGDGTFDAVQTYVTGVDSSPFDVSLADLNHDNYLDIVVSNSKTDQIAILFGDTNGTFTHRATYSTGISSMPQSVGIGDLNNDKIMDIVVTDSGTSKILILYGYSNGTFDNRTLYDLGYKYQPNSIEVADLNNDGLMDFVVACFTTDHIETWIKTC